MDLLSEVFDCIAPLHVYHHSDMKYKEEARVALNKLVDKRSYFIQAGFVDLTGLVLVKNNINNIGDTRILWRMYNSLFNLLVLRSIPFAQPSVDYYGALCFIINGKSEFMGEEYDKFPLYLSARGVLEECNKILSRCR